MIIYCVKGYFGGFFSLWLENKIHQWRVDVDMLSNPQGVLGISSDGDDWIEPNVKTQKIPKASSKTEDNPWTKINVPMNITFQTHKSQVKETKSLLKQKGIPVMVKPIDWIEAVEVLKTIRHHRTMHTIV